MTFEYSLNCVLKAEGNYCQGNGEIYISLVNMKNFVKLLESCDAITNMLITPFLINTDDGALYELHYYEFEIERFNESHSFYIEYAEGNALPKEIVNNLKPKAIVAKNDEAFLINVLNNYLTKMEGMKFEQDRKSNIRIEKASLFFQVY